MTFGQHLEELRSALFKSAAALLVGFLIGLSCGNRVVQWMQYPLEESLKQYHLDEDTEHLKKILAQRKADGEDVPDNVDELAAFMSEYGMTFDQIMIDWRQLRAELQRQHPEEFGAVQSSDKAKPKKSSDVAKPAAEGEKDPASATDAVEMSVPLSKDDLVQVFVWRSLKESERSKPKTFSAQEAFMIYIKAALISGFIIASPFIFYFVWDFVRVGLYPHERRYVNVFLPLSIGLFLAGAALAFFAVFRYVLQFLFSFNAWLGLEPDVRISEWLSFALFLPVGFGISFQLPLVMLFLERIGIFSVETYLAKWRIAVLVIAIVSMLLTPADPMSMMLMALPLWLLYFAGIAFCRYMPRGRNPLTAALD